MKLYADKLAGQLQSGLAPIYVISGDEPLQLGECADTVRKSAREQGYSEREVLDVEAGFDWQRLLDASNTMSLFAERRILELRMTSPKPGSDGSKALVAYTERPAEDTLLLITMGKVDKGSQNSKWFKALESTGVVVQVWPGEVHQLPRWITQRMHSRGLNGSADAAALLAERVEGNLLAAAQEIDKLALLHGNEPVGMDEVLDSVADSSRYDIFGLVDTVLLGQADRIPHMLNRLRGEGVHPLPVLGALAREMRSLCTMSAALAKGTSIDRVMQQAKVWPKRQPPVSAALRRYPLKAWQRMLSQCATIDRMVKGQDPGDEWEACLRLSLQMAGVWRPGGGLRPMGRHAAR